MKLVFEIARDRLTLRWKFPSCPKYANFCRWVFLLWLLP